MRREQMSARANPQSFASRHDARQSMTNGGRAVRRVLQAALTSTAASPDPPHRRLRGIPGRAARFRSFSPPEMPDASKVPDPIPAAGRAVSAVTGRAPDHEPNHAATYRGAAAFRGISGP